MKRSCADGSVTDIKISPCESRTLLNFYLCLGTEEPDAKVSGFLLSVFQLFSVTHVTVSPCERSTLLNFYLCFGTEEPDVKASGFLLSVFQLLIADLVVKHRCADGSLTDVTISPCVRTTL